MRRRRVMTAGAGAVAAWCALLAAAAGTAGAAPPAGRMAAAGSWQRAVEVPGLGALNAGGNAEVLSVSCGSAGNCAAGGFYVDSSGIGQAFVVSERDGRWRRAVEVPGLAALSAGRGAAVSSESCASAGNCVAGGGYTDGSGHRQAFVVAERDGRWRRAVEVPGSGALNAGRGAVVNAVSCASAGNCAAAGDFTDGSGRSQVFVVSERDGRWRRAIEVPGFSTLNAGGRASVLSVSCASAGNCAAGGLYRDSLARPQAFVVSERDGRWRRAVEVPGSGALNAGGNAAVDSVSCGSAGSCAAGGFYADGSGNFQAFVAGEQHGRWRRAIEVPGTAALNAGFAEVISLSCASAGNCAAGGFYTDRSRRSQAFVVTEQHGRWRRAIEVPGTAALNAGGAGAGVNSVSCASAGNCAAGGVYGGRSGHAQAFVVTEQDGRWRRAIEVPGTAALNAGSSAAVDTVSCATARSCAAGGFYRDVTHHFQGFVVSQT